jgi:hypothetical protein
MATASTTSVVKTSQVFVGARKSPLNGVPHFNMNQLSEVVESSSGALQVRLEDLTHWWEMAICMTAREGHGSAIIVENDDLS